MKEARASKNTFSFHCSSISRSREQYRICRASTGWMSLFLGPMYFILLRLNCVPLPWQVTSIKLNTHKSNKGWSPLRPYARPPPAITLKCSLAMQFLLTFLIQGLPQLRQGWQQCQKQCLEALRKQNHQSPEGNLMATPWDSRSEAAAFTARHPAMLLPQQGRSPAFCCTGLWGLTKRPSAHSWSPAGAPYAQPRLV